MSPLIKWQIARNRQEVQDHPIPDPEEVVDDAEEDSNRPSQGPRRSFPGSRYFMSRLIE